MILGQLLYTYIVPDNWYLILGKDDINFHPISTEFLN